MGEQPTKPTSTTTMSEEDRRNQRRGIIAVLAVVGVIGLFIFGSEMSDRRAPATSQGGTTANSAPVVLRPGEQFTTSSGATLEFQPVQITSHIGVPPMSSPVADGGILIVAKFRLSNTTSEPLSVLAKPTIQLVDPSGAAYGVDEEKTAFNMMISGNNPKLMSDLNPGLSVRDAVVFEVAEKGFDIETWRLQVDGVQVALK